MSRIAAAALLCLSSCVVEPGTSILCTNDVSCPTGFHCGGMYCTPDGDAEQLVDAGPIQTYGDAGELVDDGGSERDAGQTSSDAGQTSSDAGQTSSDAGNVCDNAPDAGGLGTNRDLCLSDLNCACSDVSTGARCIGHWCECLSDADCVSNPLGSTCLFGSAPVSPGGLCGPDAGG